MLSWTWQTPGQVLRLAGLPPGWRVTFHGRQAAINPAELGIQVLQQVHGARWVELHSSTPLPAHPPEADAWVVTRPGVRVGIQVADCVPLFLADPQARIFALVHAGWRGTRAGILEQVVHRLLTLGARGHRLLVAAGPAIRGCHYEVGPEFEALFPGFIEHRQGHRYLDLFQVHQAILRRLGIPQHGIVPPPYCTYEHPEWFYSYRRERVRGRMWLLAEHTPDSRSGTR